MKKIGIRLFGLLVVAMMACNATAATFNPTTGHWYELVTGSWTESEDTAVGLGGHLVTINDAAEETWIAANFGTDSLWIGMTDAANEGDWVWISGEPVSYTNWASGEPNDFETGEDYGIINWDGVQWNDLDNTSASLGVAEFVIVPEPSTWSLMCFAVAFAGYQKNRFRKA